MELSKSELVEVGTMDDFGINESFPRRYHPRYCCVDSDCESHRKAVQASDGVSMKTSKPLIAAVSLQGNG